MKLGTKDIMNLIPQRYPFLFVDRVEELVPGEKIVAFKNVSAGEAIFTGHFPGNPILPGVLIVEALAQASGILAAKSLPALDMSTPYLAGINNFKFRQPVLPGDCLRLESVIRRHLKNFIIFSCKAYVQEKVAAEGELLTVIVEAKK